MPVAVGGLSHKAAELELREKLAFSGAELERGLSGLASGSGLEELVVLSTCNRTELYAYGRDREELSSGIERILGARSGAAVSLSD
ncbi:MAG: glutamyl-tRNA reductase, partial [Gemmatimonadota bacterium]|nr:glutamyl-tRNA reductase [Gemmatimonadota bacterium]